MCCRHALHYIQNLIHIPLALRDQKGQFKGQRVGYTYSVVWGRFHLQPHLNPTHTLVYYTTQGFSHLFFAAFQSTQYLRLVYTNESEYNSNAATKG